MHTAKVSHITVLGAGSMGHGIAELAAIAGYDVTVRDIEDDLVEGGIENIEWSLDKLESKGKIDESAETILGRINGTTNLPTAVADADFVIEAVPEQMSLKQETFAAVDEHAPGGTIVASNTSGLSITEMAESTNRPERVVGTHFFNPPVKMDLVEVVHGAETSEETVETAMDLMASFGKVPIEVREDVRGFVVNNVMVPFMEEAAWMLEEGKTTVREADAAMVYLRGYPMGPFELGDYTGLDIGYHFRQEADERSPPPIAEHVENGDLGKKTGRGFYNWEDGNGPDYEPGDGEDFDTLRVEAYMVNEAAKLVGNEVATPEAVDTGTRLGARFPQGTCEMADRIGLDAILEKLEAVHAETGAERFEPADYLRELVEAGKTGKDVGEGFYDYRDGGPYHYVDVKLTDRGVLEIEFDRPERMNAFSESMFEEVERALDEYDVNDVSCAVFSGAGDAFSAGADITGFMAAEPTAMMDVDESIRAIDEFPRPTLAAIDGFCLGAGLEIAVACDMRIATEGSTLGSPEINLGLIPGGGGTQRLTRIVGEARTKELVFRGEHVSAERAADWGLVNRAVPGDKFDDVVTEFVDDFANGPKTALKVAKRVIDDGQDASLDAGLAAESQGFGLLTTTDDMVEGVTAFRDDRKPEFE